MITTYRFRTTCCTMFAPAMFLACLLTACAPAVDHAEDAANIASDVAASAGDPCKLLDLASIRRVLPGASDGVRDHRADDRGIASCEWQSPNGRLVVQTATGAPVATKKLVDMVVTGNLDPFLRGPDPIRYEPLAGIGDQAVAVVEGVDAERGIVGSIAAAGVQRGDRKMLLMSSLESAPEYRQTTLESLRELAAAAAKRL